jgi:hypothetical protein
MRPTEVHAAIEAGGVEVCVQLPLLKLCTPAI